MMAREFEKWVCNMTGICSQGVENCAIPNPDFGTIQRQQPKLPTIPKWLCRQFGLQPLDGAEGQDLGLQNSKYQKDRFTKVDFHIVIC